MSAFTPRRLWLGLAGWGALSMLLPAVCGFAHVQIGQVIDNAELPALDGSRQPLLGETAVNVFIFFAPGKTNSHRALQQMAALRRELQAKPVRWVGVVSDRVPAQSVQGVVRALKLAMPVLVDTGDAVFGRLGVKLYPTIGITDRNHRLRHYLPFHKVNYATIVRACIRHELKELSDAELDQILNPQAPKFNPNPAAARRLLKLAEKLCEAKHYAQALECVRRSLAKAPLLAEAHAVRGDILAAQGKAGQATIAYRRALELAPTNHRALKGIESGKKTVP